MELVRRVLVVIFSSSSFFFCLSFFVLFFVLINYGSSRHFDNLKNNFLVLGDGLTDVVSNSVNEPECLSLHHNTEER